MPHGEWDAQANGGTVPWIKVPVQVKTELPLIGEIQQT